VHWCATAAEAEEAALAGHAAALGTTLVKQILSGAVTPPAVARLTPAQVSILTAEFDELSAGTPCMMPGNGPDATPFLVWGRALFNPPPPPPRRWWQFWR
jgi:hypothetical protein